MGCQDEEEARAQRRKQDDYDRQAGATMHSTRARFLACRRRVGLRRCGVEPGASVSERTATAGAWARTGLLVVARTETDEWADQKAPIAITRCS